MYAESKFKIRGYHCDSYGHLNNARYLELFEEARWQLLELQSIREQIDLLGFRFYVVDIHVRYRKAVNDGYEIVIKSCINQYGRKTMVFKQEMLHDSQGLLADAAVTFVLFDPKSQRAVTLDESIKEIFAPFYEQN
jgi:thioesterase-3